MDDLRPALRHPRWILGKDSQSTVSPPRGSQEYETIDLIEEPESSTKTRARVASHGTALRADVVSASVTREPGRRKPIAILPQSVISALGIIEDSEWTSASDAARPRHSKSDTKDNLSRWSRSVRHEGYYVPTNKRYPGSVNYLTHLKSMAAGTGSTPGYGQWPEQEGPTSEVKAREGIAGAVDDVLTWIAAEDKKLDVERTAKATKSSDIWCGPWT